MPVTLIRKTEISDDAIRYLRELKRAGGTVSRGIKAHDYLTAPDFGSRLYGGLTECWKYKLVVKADGGHHSEYVKTTLTEAGFEVLKAAKGQKV